MIYIELEFLFALQNYIRRCNYQNAITWSHVINAQKRNWRSHCHLYPVFDTDV